MAVTSELCLVFVRERFIYSCRNMPLSESLRESLCQITFSKVKDDARRGVRPQMFFSVGKIDPESSMWQGSAHCKGKAIHLAEQESVDTEGVVMLMLDSTELRALFLQYLAFLLFFFSDYTFDRQCKPFQQDVMRSSRPLSMKETQNTFCFNLRLPRLITFPSK